MTPFNLLNATIRKIIEKTSPAAVKQSIKTVTPKVAVKTALDYGPDVAIGVPVEMAMSSKPDLRRALLNAVGEIGLTAATGGTNAIPQITELVSSFNRQDPTWRLVNSLSRVSNPSRITEGLTETILYGQRDPNEARLDLDAAKEAEQTIRMIKQATGSSGFGS